MRKSALENAKTAAKTAVDVMAVVAEVTENVPYLGAISAALTAFKDVLDVRLHHIVPALVLTMNRDQQEVDVCKEDCRAATDDAKEFRDSIQKFEAKWGRLESDGDDGLREAFDDLSRCVPATRTLALC